MRLCVFLFVLLITWSNAKQFTRCGVAQELVNLGFERSFISSWVCLIESESGRNTSKRTIKPDRSESFGLFQINNKDWCKTGQKGGKCNVKCEDFLNDDVWDDSVCAMKIRKEKGFKAWEGYSSGCYIFAKNVTLLSAIFTPTCCNLQFPDGSPKKNLSSYKKPKQYHLVNNDTCSLSYSPGNSNKQYSYRTV